MNKDYLLELYLTDPEFVSTYHGNIGWTAEQCAEDSWNIIKDTEIHIFDFGYFNIDRYGDIAPTLCGFFIKPEYRNIEGKQWFIKELYQAMPKIFLSGLHNKNIRGIKFLEKLPGARLITTTDSYTYFVFRQEN